MQRRGISRVCTQALKQIGRAEKAAQHQELRRSLLMAQATGEGQQVTWTASDLIHHIPQHSFFFFFSHLLLCTFFSCLE